MDTVNQPVSEQPPAPHSDDMAREAGTLRPPAAPPTSSHHGRRTPVAAWVLIGVGAFFFLQNFGYVWQLGRLWPLILVAVGLIMLRSRRD